MVWSWNGYQNSKYWITVGNYQRGGNQSLFSIQMRGIDELSTYLVLPILSTLQVTQSDARQCTCLGTFVTIASLHTRQSLIGTESIRCWLRLPRSLLGTVLIWIVCQHLSLESPLLWSPFWVTTLSYCRFCSLTFREEDCFWVLEVCFNVVFK